MRWATRLAAMVWVVWSVSVAAVAQEMRAADPPAESTWIQPTLPDGWVTVNGPALRVHGPETDHATLDRLARRTSQSLPRIADALGVPIGGDIEIYLADSDATFRALQPGLTPEWADGTAWPEGGAIFLRNPRIRGGTARPLEMVLDHELVHVLLGRVFAPTPVPRWLQEGLAQVYAGEAGPEITDRINRGLLGVEPLPLASLTHGFPRDARRADLAYAQSADFILYFRERWGEPALQAMVKEIAAGRTVEGAMLDITGHTLPNVSAEWLSRLGGPLSPWMSSTNLTDVLFGATAAGLLGLGWSRRRTLRTRMSSWQSTDGALKRLAREVLQRRQLHVRGPG